MTASPLLFILRCCDFGFFIPESLNSSSLGLLKCRILVCRNVGFLSRPFNAFGISRFAIPRCKGCLVLAPLTSWYPKYRCVAIERSTATIQSASYIPDPFSTFLRGGGQEFVALSLRIPSTRSAEMAPFGNFLETSILHHLSSSDEWSRRFRDF